MIPSHFTGVMLPLPLPTVQSVFKVVQLRELRIFISGQQADSNIPAKSAIARASPESARSLLGNRSSIGSTSEAEYFSKSEKKNELNLYDWLSATNSPRQKSSSSEENVAQPYLVHSDFDQFKACTLIHDFCFGCSSYSRNYQFPSGCRIFSLLL